MSHEAGALGAGLAGAAAALVATVASTCCVGPVMAPLMVAVLGAGGAAWAAGLRPYSPYFLVASLAMLLYGFYTVYRRPACSDDTCPVRRPLPPRIALWVAAPLWVLSAALNLWTSLGGS